MRFVPTSLVALVLGSLLFGSGLWSADATTPGTLAVPPTPDVIATGWAQALKRNDLSGAFTLFTAADQTSLTHLWRKQVSRPDAYTDVQIDTLLRLAQNSTASDQLLAMSQPYLALIDVPRLTKGISEIAGFLNTAAQSQPAGTTGPLDYAGLRDWLKDLAVWVPNAGLTDQGKAKTAAGHLVRALNASGLKSAAELRALPLPELLARLDPAMPALKDLLAVYDIPVDALLGSFSAKLADASPEQATVALSFSSLGKPRAITLKLVQKNGAWQLASGNDNPLTGLSQLVMMALLMQNLGGAPAQPTPAAPDDGAL